MELRYWDSDCFLGWLAEEEDKVDECRAVLQEAGAGRIQLITSALTLAEVIKLKKGRAPIPATDAQKVKAFFKQDYIAVRGVDRYLAEEARQLVWDNTALDPKDAIHVATAIRLRVAVLNTFDGPLIGLSGNLGDPPLSIERPRVMQTKLGLEPS